MAGDDVQYTYKATSHAPGRPRGFYTDSAQLDDGVNVQGNVVGVYGEALANSPGTRKAPSGTGVCGLGDNVGVIGQGDPAGPVPQSPSLETGVLGIGDSGVYGQGETFGVQGGSAFTDAAGSKGTGVQGTTLQGIGVWGVCSGATQPFVGVLGSSQALSPVSPYPTTTGQLKEYFGTGVLGAGDKYGGAFQATPILDQTSGISPTFANIQLTPIDLQDNPEQIVATAYRPQKPPIAPSLPLSGQPGDVIVVRQTPVQDNVQMWICLSPPPGTRPSGAIWARVTFDYIYETRPTP